MQQLDKYDLFLFDFDGLLVNTEEIHKAAYDEMLYHRGYALNWDFKTYATYAHRSTTAFSNAVYTALPRLKEEEPDWEKLRQEKITIYTDMLSSDLALMPGAHDFLSIIDKPKVVVTNSPRAQVDAIRAKLPELEIIDKWIAREDYDAPKPAPDGYLLACKLYNAKAPIGFEDTEKGLTSLTRAHVEPVLIRPPNYPETTTCKNTFDSFTTLLERCADRRESQAAQE